jgi:ectoine hydroxylase-related dioxygenase (phytanoyl-CoA dioxygenase family)
MSPLRCSTNGQWLRDTLEALRDVGYAVVEGVIPPTMVEETARRLYSVRDRIVADVGEERLRRAGELGVLRLMMKYDRYFTRYLEVPGMLAVIDATVSPTAILHLQNGFILPSFPPGETPRVFQNQFHMDFRRVLNGYPASINLFIAISEFTPESGATLVVPGSHQKTETPDPEYLVRHAVSLTGPPGSMIVFDSTLWHAAGRNVSGRDRLSINHQFTRSWIKQQIDYVRALGDEMILSLPERSQQLLGWYTRVVTSLDEYYQPPEKRLYRSGQG